MTVLAPQSNGMYRRCSVERGPARELLSRPGVFVPLPAEYPLPFRRLLCSLAHQRRYLVLAGAGSCVDVMSAIGIAEQVHVRVDKAGQDGFAAQVHQFGMKATGAAYLVIVAYCYNATADAVDGHGLGSRPGCVHGIDIAVEKENGAHKIPLSFTGNGRESSCLSKRGMKRPPDASRELTSRAVSLDIYAPL